MYIWVDIQGMFWKAFLNNNFYDFNMFQKDSANMTMV